MGGEGADVDVVKILVAKSDHVSAAKVELWAWHLEFGEDEWERRLPRCQEPLMTGLQLRVARNLSRLQNLRAFTAFNCLRLSAITLGKLSQVQDS